MGLRTGRKKEEEDRGKEEDVVVEDKVTLYSISYMKLLHTRYIIHIIYEDIILDT